jgi:hypothetical protein
MLGKSIQHPNCPSDALCFFIFFPFLSLRGSLLCLLGLVGNLRLGTVLACCLHHRQHALKGLA